MGHHLVAVLMKELNGLWMMLCMSWHIFGKTRLDCCSFGRGLRTPSLGHLHPAHRRSEFPWNHHFCFAKSHEITILMVKSHQQTPFFVVHILYESCFFMVSSHESFQLQPGRLHPGWCLLRRAAPRHARGSRGPALAADGAGDVCDLVKFFFGKILWFTGYWIVYVTWKGYCSMWLVLCDYVYWKWLGFHGKCHGDFTIVNNGLELAWRRAWFTGLLIWISWWLNGVWMKVNDDWIWFVVFFSMVLFSLIQLKNICVPGICTIGIILS